MVRRQRLGPFIAQVEAWRQDLGLNHTEFAALLDVDLGFWSKVRRGLRPVNVSFARKVIQRKPELGFAWAAELAANGHDQGTVPVAAGEGR